MGPRVQIHLDRLVLDGLDGVTPADVAAALTRSLEAQLATGAPGRFTAGGAASHVMADLHLALPAGGDLRVACDDLARALISQLSAPAEAPIPGGPAPGGERRQR